MAQDAHRLQHASAALRADADAVRGAAKQWPHALRFASKALRADRGVIHEAVFAFSEAIQYAGEELRGDPAIICAAVEVPTAHTTTLERAVRRRARASPWGAALRYAPPELLSKPRFVRAVVQRSGDRCSRLPLSELGANAGFVRTALTVCGGHCIMFASRALCADPDLVRLALTCGDLDWRERPYTPHRLALHYASSELRADRDTVLAAVTANGLALAHASIALRSDRRIVRAAVKCSGLSNRPAGMLRIPRSFLQARQAC